MIRQEKILRECPYLCPEVASNKWLTPSALRRWCSTTTLRSPLTEAITELMPMVVLSNALSLDHLRI